MCVQSQRDTKEEVAKVFALFEPDAHGRITLRDLKRVITDLGENISEEEMRDMIQEADRDHDGTHRTTAAASWRCTQLCAACTYASHACAG
ncbi:hypothetical protein EON67_04660, partial [archaeon]